MPKPLPARKRTAILADIKTGAKARNQIARDHGVSASTVTKIAKDAGIADAFDRSQTAKGTRAQQADNAAVRAELIREYYAVARRLLRRVEQPHTIALMGAEGAELVTTDLPSLRDAQAGMAASAIGIDKALRLEDRQGDGKVDAAKSLLGAMFETLQRAHGDSPDGSG
jgi:transposase-like protein